LTLESRIKVLKISESAYKKARAIRSTRDNATWMLTSDESIRERERLALESSLSAGLNPGAVVCSAGATPNRIAVTTASAVVNARTCMFGVKSKTTFCGPLESISRRVRHVSHANPIPTAAPETASIALSVRS